MRLWPIRARCSSYICDKIWEKRVYFVLNSDKGVQSHRLCSWFTSTPAQSNIRKCSYVLTWNGGAWKCGIKRLIFNLIWKSRSQHPYRNWGCGKFSAIVSNDWRLLESPYLVSRHEIIVLMLCAIEKKSGHYAKLTLISDPYLQGECAL